MCIFSGDEGSYPLRSVKSTSIYAAELAEGARQGLIYQMTYEAGADLAMILPLPVPPGTGEDAVTFVDLSGYPSLFGDMGKGFVGSADEMGDLADLGIDESPRPLKVHQVGSFEASFVPSIPAFARLDERFRLSPTVWDQLPAYADYGFAVFKLKAGNVHVHPMAFTFPRRDPHRLFFPTVHVHDGRVHEDAVFAHSLYCQFHSAAGAPPQKSKWTASHAPYRATTFKELVALVRTPLLSGRFIDCARTGGLVHPDRLLYYDRIHGKAPNADTWVDVEG